MKKILGVDNSSKNPQNGSMASAVRANKPIPPICGIYYFEVRFFSKLKYYSSYLVYFIIE